MTFDPMLATSWRTLSSRPRPIEDTPITTATPITIPSTVRRRAQLVAADGVGRHLDDFAEFGFANHGDSAIVKFGNSPFVIRK